MFKIGDKVIVSKGISNIANKKAIVKYYSESHEFYRVEFLDKSTCNIFFNHFNESISLDIEETRNSIIEKILNYENL